MGWMFLYRRFSFGARAALPPGPWHHLSLHSYCPSHKGWTVI